MANSNRSFYDSDPFAVAGFMFVSLFPGFVMTGSLCAFGMLIAAVLISPGYTITELSIAFALCLFAGATIAACTGFCACIFLALFNQSVGRILSPTVFAVSSVGMSAIPVSFVGMAWYASSSDPDSNFYMYLYYVAAILVGAIFGIWCGSWRGYRFKTEFKTSWQFNTRQLLAITGWIAIFLALGFGNWTCFIAVILYATIVTGTVLGFSKLNLFLEENSGI